jgi:HSP90 family molecular chaperone
MVADKVTVISRTAGGKGYKWSSDGKNGYEIEEVAKEKEEQMLFFI